MAVWRAIWRIVWDFSEWAGLDLGRLAPWVFGQMIGCRGRRVD